MQHHHIPADSSPVPPDADRERRRAFTQELRRDVAVVPVTGEIAELAGHIEGEQAARGVSNAFEDLLIGATALHMNYTVVTLNLRLALRGGYLRRDLDEWSRRGSDARVGIVEWRSDSRRLGSVTVCGCRQQYSWFAVFA